MIRLKMKKYNMILSVLSSGKIDKYQYLTGEEILLSNQNQIIEQAKFTYSALGKAFEKQTKTTEEQTKIIKDKGEKQVKAIKSNEDIDKNEKLCEDKTFNELLDESMGKICYLSKQIAFNNLTYYFKNKDITPTNFISFRCPFHLYKNIFNGDANIEQAETDQKQFKLDLNEIIETKFQKIKRKIN